MTWILILLAVAVTLTVVLARRRDSETVQVDPVTEDTPTPEVWNGTMDLYYACYHGGAGTIAIAARQYIYDGIHVTVRVVLDNHILKADITQVQGGVERYALVDYARAERVLELVHQLDHDPTATDLYAIIEIMRDYEGAPCTVETVGDVDAPDYIDIDVPAVYGRYYCRAWDARAHYDPDTGRTVILNRAFVRPGETRAACVVRAYLYQGEAYCEILSGPTTYAQLEGINALKAIEDAICLDVPALHSWLVASVEARARAAAKAS